MICWVTYTVAIVLILFAVESYVCAGISHPDITGNVSCFGIMEFYADGVRYPHNNDNMRHAISRINIPSSTQVVAITCRNDGNVCGISAALSNGIKTDSSWKCSDGEEYGWNNVAFDDKAWGNAKLLPFWIWTSVETTGQGTIYCRKSINSTITDQEITVKAYCNDILEFYADGVRYQQASDDKWDIVSSINISSSTQLVAVKCYNREGFRGLNVGLSNGVRTDTSWKCSDDYEEGWNTTGFNDSAWNNAKHPHVSNVDWIWTNDDAMDNGTTYCRKSLLLGTSSTTTTVMELSTAATSTVAEPFPPTTTAQSFDYLNASYSKSSVVINTCDPSRFLESIYTSLEMDCARACTKKADCKRYLYCSRDSSCKLYQDGRNCVMSGDTTGCSCYTQDIRCEDSNCTCPLGKYGEGCHDIISDCTEGFQKGLRSTKDILTTIKPLASPDPVEVLCTFDDGGWTGILGRNKSCLHENFNRTLEEYEEGFGNVTFNKWLGFKQILSLLDNPINTYNLRVVLVKPDVSTCISQYTNFVVGNKSTSYTLYISGYANVGTSCGDSLTGTTNLNNNPFSTYDDDYTGHWTCAQRFGGGWWYDSHVDCTSGFLTGSMNGSRTDNFWNESLSDSALNEIYLQLQWN